MCRNIHGDKSIYHDNEEKIINIEGKESYMRRFEGKKGQGKIM